MHRFAWIAKGSRAGEECLSAGGEAQHFRLQECPALWHALLAWTAFGDLGSLKAALTLRRSYGSVKTLEGIRWNKLRKLEPAIQQSAVR